MARISKKKSVKRSVKPAVSDPNLNTNVAEDDLVLINRDNIDYSTDVADLAAGIGASLGLGDIVTEINTEIGAIDGGLTDLTGRVEKNEADIGEINGWLGDDSANGSGDTISDRVLNLEEATGDLGDKIDVNTDLIKENTTNIEANKDAIDELEADQARQNSWTGTPASGDNSGKTFKEQIDDNADAIARLQGALVYRGIGDFTQAPTDVHQADFYLATANGPATGWNGISQVEENHYYAYDGSKWQDAGAHAVVVEDPNDGALTLVSDDTAIKVLVGSGFDANSENAVEYKIGLDLNDEGGLEISGDGLGIHPKPDSGIIVDGDGIQIDDDYIQKIAGPVPPLQLVTDEGATTNNTIVITDGEGLTAATGTVAALNVKATGDQDDSSFIFRDISKLPALKDA